MRSMFTLGPGVPFSCFPVAGQATADVLGRVTITVLGYRWAIDRPVSERQRGGGEGVLPATVTSMQTVKRDGGQRERKREENKGK
jgi:hypothetical protein